MTFSLALENLKSGKRVTRTGWHGAWKGSMWVMLLAPPESVQAQSLSHLKPLPFLMIKTPYDEIVPWNPCQQDILAEDWEISTAAQ